MAMKETQTRRRKRKTIKDQEEGMTEKGVLNSTPVCSGRAPLTGAYLRGHLPDACTGRLAGTGRRRTRPPASSRTSRGAVGGYLPRGDWLLLGEEEEGEWVGEVSHSSHEQ